MLMDVRPRLGAAREARDCPLPLATATIHRSAVLHYLTRIALEPLILSAELYTPSLRLTHVHPRPRLSRRRDALRAHGGG